MKHCASVFKKVKAAPCIQPKNEREMDIVQNSQGGRVSRMDMYL